MSNSENISTTENIESKMARAIKIYKKLIINDGVKRKDIIAEFINCGLTSAGASTYYNIIKKKYNNQEKI